MAEIRKYPRTGQDCPVGYKNCDGYIIPNEWSVVRFNSLFKRLTRKNDENNQNVLTISAQQGLVSQMNYYNTLYASENKEGYSLLHKGDFSYNKSYSSEYAYGAIKRLDAYDKGIVSPLYICFTPQQGTNSDFYLQYFEAGCFNREIYKIAQEGARNHGLLNVPTEDFFNSMLVFPPLAEQERIAEILMQCDKVIELKQKIIDELKQLKKVCLRRMFPAKGYDKPETRFPGFSDAWEQRKLSCIYQNIGNAFVGTATPYYVDNGHFYLESNNVKDGQINRNSEIFINDEFYEKQKDKWLHTGDMVMVQSGHVGHAAVIPEELNNLAAHALIMFRNPIVKIEPYFLNYQYQTLKAQKKIENIMTGNTIKHILASDMQEFVVDVSSYEEQSKIAEYFKNLDNLITLHQRELEESKKKKKALAKLLLTGIVRVRV
ncbi:MAG: restriction endonuclease subunit S [Oscillospiraceae bacterium]